MVLCSRFKQQATFNRQNFQYQLYSCVSETISRMNTATQTKFLLQSKFNCYFCGRNWTKITNDGKSRCPKCKEEIISYEDVCIYFELYLNFFPNWFYFRDFFNLLQFFYAATNQMEPHKVMNGTLKLQHSFGTIRLNHFLDKSKHVTILREFNKKKFFSFSKNVFVFPSLMF